MNPAAFVPQIRHAEAEPDSAFAFRPNASGSLRRSSRHGTTKGNGGDAYVMEV
jgi:hypothetical protein